MTSEDFIHRIELQYSNQLPFVVYRKPNDLKVNGLFQSTTHLFSTEKFVEKGFVFSPFDNSEKAVLIPTESSEFLSCPDWEPKPIKLKQEAILQNPLDSSKEFYINLVGKAVETIKNKFFKKVVISRQETLHIKETNPISIFKNLLSNYKSAFVYCWYHPKVGLWLGATPETLIKIEEKRFSIMALAGTQNFKGSLDVVWQDKEKQEQQFVTDFIVDQLKPSVDSIKISDVETVKAGNLLHLKTMISAQLKKDTHLKQIIDSLHPTPAVCGLPKIEAKQFILTNENYKREFYTGFLGELNFDIIRAPRSGKRNIENRAYAIKKRSTQLYVNLRCMQIKKNKALIYVGGGITENSNIEKEWEETVSKSLVIKKVL